MRRLKPISTQDAEDLKSRVQFCTRTGHIWLHEHRMLLVHAEAQAAMRKELIDTLGIERARGILTRMGYASGTRDAELAKDRAEYASDLEAFMTGPQLHTLEGIVRATPIKLEFDRMKGNFYAEILWENSWEGQAHRRDYGVHSEPVCWTQIGYACGYTSAFMGRPILYKEIECVGTGHDQCKIVGKPVEEWDDAAQHMKFFNPEPIAEQLFYLQSQVTQLRSSMSEKAMPVDMVGESVGFRQAYELLAKAAQSQITVLLSGETGVGKEIFARRLHDMSPRSHEPFVAVNCAAIPHELVEAELFGVEKGAFTGAAVSRAGRFERAHNGTLFLDEIGDLPLPVQAKLLRVLQENEVERLGDHRTRKVNVRLITATNANLQQLVKEGRFRSDLYYRLNAYEIWIPPLRERAEDVRLLARAFLDKYSAIHQKKLLDFTEKAKRALLSYTWPGNIRELQNMIERGVMLAPNGGRIETEHLFTALDERQFAETGLDPRGGLDVRGLGNGEELCSAVLNGTLTLDEMETLLLESAVNKAGGNLSQAARLLGITRPQLAYRLKRTPGEQREAASGRASGRRAAVQPKPETH